MQTVASIYVRTPQGRVSAFNTGSKLPAHLKRLLQAVDGKTPSAHLTEHWRAQGDIARWLGQLESSGLIEDKQAISRTSGYVQDSDQIWGIARAPEPASNVRYMRNTPANELRPSASSFMPALNSSWQVTAAGGLEGDMPAPSMESIMANMTQQVVDVMATFVLTHLPEKAFEVLKDLESLRSVGQLKATLPSYEMMVRCVGAAGHQHMEDVQMLMRQQFAPS